MACWLVTMATMHQVSGNMDPLARPRFDASLGLSALPQTAAASAQRLVHPTKFARLGLPPLDVAARAVRQPETPQAALKIESAKLGLALALAKSNADLRPAMQMASAQATAPSPGPMAAIQTVHVAVAGPKLPAAPALPPLAAATPADPSGEGAPVETAEADIAPIRPHAMVEPDPQKTGALAKPFSLVLSNSETAEPLPDLGSLPLARPGMAAEARRALAPADVDEDEDESPIPARRKPARTELAYAKPDSPIEDDAPLRSPLIGRRGVAVYDISAGRVHMPNGEVLEAHSGIGKMRDNPDFVHISMRGPTPPGTYKVTLRESLFHGVEAVRLTPIDGVAPHGRVGLLAHSYLLRTRGDSHGCVAFADYPRFLKAFKRGEISQMVIVKSLKGGFSPQKKTLASLFSWGK
ncbi:DUF2778 domain-containing protein [Xaviernesmea oryzae]|nr:DUF2778 domain-containing protein [Xaviernesmea oryzae]SEL55033.1 Protein of unknown function [Xaviernesmea oryzae]